jgi:hypothetical protein
MKKEIEALKKLNMDLYNTMVKPDTKTTQATKKNQQN